MDRYEVTITGVSPLLLHRDNIEFADELKAWRQKPENQKLSVAGDDRSPAFTWIGCLYYLADDGSIVMPSDNLMRCFMEGGALVPVPKGKNGKTFKAQTQSGMVPTEEGWAIEVDGKELEIADILDLRREFDFATHQQYAVDHGFGLFVKRAKIGTSKHVRVRPKFPRWTLRGQIDVWDEQITIAALRSIIEQAGALKGLGDWRPSGKTPGPYGRFTAEIAKA